MNHKDIIRVTILTLLQTADVITPLIRILILEPCGCDHSFESSRRDHLNEWSHNRGRHVKK